MSSPPPAAPTGRRGRGPRRPRAGDLEAGALPPVGAAGGTRRRLASAVQLGARDDGRAVLLLFVLLVVAQQTGLLHAIVMGMILLTCMRLVLFCLAVGAQLNQLEQEEAGLDSAESRAALLSTVLSHSAETGALNPLLLQLQLMGRDIDPRDYAALLQLDESNTHDRRGLSPEQLAALPRHTVPPDSEAAARSSDGAAVTCPICLEDAVAGEVVCALPCAHQFHSDCIDRWLAASTSCPVCKQTVVAASREEEEGT
jgi:hypothetical protein